GHQETALAHRRFARRRAAAVDRGVLADDGAAADLHPGFLALVLEVLRVVADDGAVADFHAVAQPRVALDHRVGRDAAALPHGDLGANHAVGPDGDVSPQLGGRIDQRRSMDHLSTTIAIISASATTCPSTNPAPF